jgi:hypothetical protein
MFITIFVVVFLSVNPDEKFESNTESTPTVPLHNETPLPTAPIADASLDNQAIPATAFNGADTGINKLDISPPFLIIQFNTFHAYFHILSSATEAYSKSLRSVAFVVKTF